MPGSRHQWQIADRFLYAYPADKPRRRKPAAAPALIKIVYPRNLWISLWVRAEDESQLIDGNMLISRTQPVIRQFALALLMTGIQAAHAEDRFYRPFEVTGSGLKNPDEDISNGQSRVRMAALRTTRGFRR